MIENKPLIWTEYDWVEDCRGKTGYYKKNCKECKTKFFGYKKQFICKKCFIKCLEEHARQLGKEFNKVLKKGTK